MIMMLATLCLNEMEWLPKLYEQHKDWPGMSSWVFVEAADRQYAKANPKLVSSCGLSVDGTSEFLQKLAADDDRVKYIPHGFSEHADPAQGKCAARQRYMDVANEVRPEFVVTVDADEFYTKSDQKRLADMLPRVSERLTGVVVRYHNIWRPDSIASEPLFQWEIVGNFWHICVCKIWRWSPGTRYSGNHNSPECKGNLLNRRLLRLDRGNAHPRFIHMGFASGVTTRLAKNRYYKQRGEGRTDHRGAYVKSRAAFSNWAPGVQLPNGDKVIPYKGPIPEVFLNEHLHSRRANQLLR
jgi:glycosyltransferase involved in cell wall biosynthesis